MKRCGLLVGAATLAACARWQPPLVTEPSLPATYAHAAAGEMASPGMPTLGRAWWSAWQDGHLDRLVTQAEQHNLDIQQSWQRLRQAQALLQGTRAQQRPSLQGQVGHTRQGGDNSSATSISTVSGPWWSLGLSLSYELDLLGRGEQALAATQQDVRAREALWHNTRLMVQTQVVQSWLALQALSQERVLVSQSLRNAQDSVALLQRRQQLGLLAPRELQSARSEVSAVQIELSDLVLREAELQHALALLLGSGLESVRALLQAPTPAQTPGVSMSAGPQIPMGVPSALLQRRADIVAAHAKVQAAGQRWGLARTAGWPTLSLTSAGGAASAELTQWLSAASRGWGVAALASGTLWDAGRRQAGTAQAEAEWQEAQAAYQGQVWTALKEVEDQLVAVRARQEQAQAAGLAVVHAVRARVATESAERRGLLSHVEVLQARRAEGRERRTWLQAQSARQLATVGLVRALGGGWEP